ncbi:MAG: acyl-CoA thioesterase [Chitinophagaceae bacterium]|nr:MAG: acyl-CoA thioesterase [Chitinophagaceae bacterium]
MSKQSGKSPKDSQTIKTEVVLPNDTNTLNNLRGGKILHWMDVASAISAARHAEKPVVTASVDNVSFENPIKLGDVVTIQARVTRAFNSSLETFIEVWAEDVPAKKKYKSNEAFYTFVALDSNMKPTPVPALVPETPNEQKLYEAALRRRELRLVLAGRMKPEDATELKSIFIK